MCADDLPLLGAGREADVFAFGDGQVLRRYRTGGDVSHEAAVMRHVWEHGFPVPAVHRAYGPDLVLERVDGPTMLGALASEAISPVAAAEVLTDLHRRLHELPPWRAREASDRILHLDLHPDNVLLSSRGPVLIDWRNAREGSTDLDVALTAVILAEAAAGSHLPPDLVPAARELLAAFLGRAGGDPLDRLDRAVAMRADNPTLSAAEVSRLRQAAALVRAGLPSG